ncbi:DEAD DEAH box ATP-dependent RNA helicase [Babesia ovis]|uniref:RNA helicase n=1 Tax=Babesia ovis TaxID=5869 RepID=A0A9W5TAD4_BABOV|nr:DEAD DEAH box ATP-dependent RNA helicase [Babesia ovis]
MEGQQPSSKKAKKADQIADMAPREQRYTHVHVERQFDVNLRRIKLPACMMEQEIVDSIKHNDVVVITGGTGCGKSTQVPQFLYENGFCVDKYIIGVTQVRRVACLALYQQVSLELNSTQLVGYQYRFNRGYNQRHCRIKFMTDGILLQEIKEDILCSKYSVLIIDEAHERNLNCDVLIGILSRVVQERRVRYESGESEIPPLKLVIMSATIRAEDFLDTKIFKGHVAHCHIPTEFATNTIHFSRRSVTDYVEDAYDKILKIHRRLPPGSVLVFLTGKDELFRLKKLLEPHEKINKLTNKLDVCSTQGDDAGKDRDQPNEVHEDDINDHIGDRVLEITEDIPCGPTMEPSDDDPIFDLESSSDEGNSISDSDDCDIMTADKELNTIAVEGVSNIAVEGIHNSAFDHAVNNTDVDGIDISTTTECQFKTSVESVYSSCDTGGISTEPPDISLTRFNNYSILSTTENSDAQHDTDDCTTDNNVDINTTVDTVQDMILVESDNEHDGSSDHEFQVELDVISRSYKKLSDIRWHGAGAGAGRIKAIVMHASQTMDVQMEAFRMPNDDERIVILSTNVAETAVTLPNIRYVIDCGKEKRRLDDIQRGLSRFVISDISKASAKQRSGRAGRVGKGHCYRQYTSSVYETLFEENSPVEISTCNLESTILLLSSMGIENPYYFNFLTPPPVDNIRSAMQVLAVLGAIETPSLLLKQRHSIHNEITMNPFKLSPMYPYTSTYEVLQQLKTARITQLGQYLAVLPMHPRFAKMIFCVLSKNPNAATIHCACCVISALAFGAANLVTPRVPGDDPERKPIPSLRSDVELFIWICCRYSQCNPKDRSAYCKQYGINQRLLREVFQQAEQVYRALKSALGDHMKIDIDWTQPLQTPDKTTKSIIEDAIVECTVDKVAVLVQRLSGEAHEGLDNAYRTGALASIRKNVFLPRPYCKHKPDCVVYGGLVGDGKVKIQDVLPTDATTLCTIKSPLIIADKIQKQPLPRYNPETDCVEAFVHKVYAPLDFPLGVAKAVLNPQHPMATRVFAQQLCLGNVFAELAPYKESLEVNPSDFLAPSKANGPLAAMLMALRRNHVSSKATFTQRHRENNRFLLQEFRQLLRKGSFNDAELERVFLGITRD